MRTIKFRGKRVDNGEWVYGYYYKTSQGHTRLHCPQSVFKQHFAVIPETVGQYTGLKDKKGVEIYEGDIVHYVYEPGEGFWNANQNSIIVWGATGYKLDGIKGTNKYSLIQGWLISIPHDNGKLLEVIGSIHDNPELMEAQTDE